MLSPKISIIVPVYKVENELKRCMDSLLNQTLKDIEIILVDDGSPDKCPQLCDNYALEDNRIKVIHKENGGLSDARNVGLIHANGDYILFVDSDDYISSNACEVLYFHAIKDDLDIVVGDAKRIEKHEERLMSHANISLNKIMKGTDFLKEQLKYHGMHMAAWLNLYKKDFLIENELFFKKGILHEDEQWTPRVFLKANNVKYIRFAFYYYIIRENSITRNKDRTKNGIDLINTCYELEKIYEKVEDKELKELLNDYLVMLFLHAINYGDLYEKKYNELYSKDFLMGKSISIKNKMKVRLFMFNKRIYKWMNKITKILQSLK